MLSNDGVSKIAFCEELQELYNKMSERALRDYVPTDREFSFFVLAREFYPETVKECFSDYELLSSGVAAIFRRR